MKRRFKVFTVLMAIVAVFGLFGCGGGEQSGEGSTSSSSSSVVDSSTSSSEEESSSSSAVDPTKPYGSWELTEFIKAESATYSISGIGYELSMKNSVDGTILGGSGADVVIEGEEEECTFLTLKGNEVGELRPAEGGTGTFKNLTIFGGTGTEVEEFSTHRVGYFGVAGKMRFENCVIEGSVQVRDGADVTFENCTFVSPATKKYAVWVSDGNASFVNCTFEGYRGLKLHEQKKYGYDIVGVYLDGCVFSNLSVKPGIAIGTIEVDPTSTTLWVKNCTFIGCQSWDVAGSVEGVDGFYEADVATSSFNFISENNYVNGNLLG